MGKNSFSVTHMEATTHVLAKPYVLLTLALGAPPVLAWDTACSGLHTCFSSLHVAEDFDGICSAAKVRIHPIVTCGQKKQYHDKFNVQSVQSDVKLEISILNIILDSSMSLFSKRMLIVLPILIFWHV